MKPTGNLLAHNNLAVSLAVGWTLLIAILCLVRFSALPGVKVSGADKYAHFIFHFVFMVLWSWSGFSLGKNRLGSLFLISFGYGALIEFLQETFTTTRHADIYDVMANTAGGLTALILLQFLKRRQLT